MTVDHVFHRDFSKKYPLITHGEGIFLFDENGNKYLDASSGAIAANLGHGNTQIADAMANQARKVGFVHTLRFETEVLGQLAQKIANLAPEGFNTVYFTSGGSEANESAIKLAKQLHTDAGHSSKQIVIGRWQSYHGNTLGSLSAGGDIKRRQLYSPLLVNYAHIHSPNCIRCPYQRQREDCIKEKNASCITSLEQLIGQIGPDNVSAFIVEPIVGSQLGAVVPPDHYLQEVSLICKRHNIMLIADEVMTGFGRTGQHFAIDHFQNIPDIITFGKGVSAGYAPLAGMIVHDRLIENLINNGNGKFVHGYTYSGHPVSVAAGLAALTIYEHDLVLEHAQMMGAYLYQKLKKLQKLYPVIFDVRGKGLLLGLELALNTGEPFPANCHIADRINEIAMERGAVFYPGSGSVNGLEGDHLLIAPPLIIATEEIDEMVTILEDSLEIFLKEWGLLRDDILKHTRESE